MSAENKTPGSGRPATILALLALVIAIGGYLSSHSAPSAQPAAAAAAMPGLLDKVDKEGVMHAGYGVYPPYSIEDPNTRKVTGFSVEVIEHIAAALGKKVVWHRINWDTMSADLKRGQFDVIADPIFQTIPRAPEFAFSEPYAYFADGIAVVRPDETRFTTFDNLNQKGLRINVGLGQASAALAKERLGDAEVLPIPVSNDLMHLFQELLAGRVDAVVSDLPNAQRVVAEHPGQLKALWVESPPAYMPAGFALRPDDTRGAEFLSVSIRYLRTTGVLGDLARKYNVTTTSPPR